MRDDRSKQALPRPKPPLLLLVVPQFVVEHDETLEDESPLQELHLESGRKELDDCLQI